MWFTEDAWSPIVVCVLIAALCLAAAFMAQRAKLLWAVAVMLVAAVAIFFVERAIVTDTEQVEGQLTELVDTFVRESKETPKNKQPQCVRFFAERNDRDKARIAAAVALVRVNDVRVTDVQIKVTNQGTRALTQFRANGTVAIGSEGGHFPTRWELSWQKEAGEWRVTTTRMLNTVNGTEVAIPRVDH